MTKALELQRKSQVLPSLLKLMAPENKFLGDPFPGKLLNIWQLKTAQILAIGAR